MTALTNHLQKLQMAVASPNPVGHFAEAGNETPTISSIVQTSIQQLRDPLNLTPNERISTRLEILSIKFTTLDLIKNHEKKFKWMLLAAIIISIAVVVFFPLNPLMGIPLFVVLAKNWVDKRKMNQLRVELKDAAEFALNHSEEVAKLAHLAHDGFEKELIKHRVEDKELSDFFQVEARKKMQSVTLEGIVQQFAMDVGRDITYIITDEESSQNQPVVMPPAYISDTPMKKQAAHDGLVDLNEPEWVKPIESVCNQISLTTFLNGAMSEFNTFSVIDPVDLEDRTLALQVKDSGAKKPIEMTIKRGANGSIERINFTVKHTMDFVAQSMDGDNTVTVIQEKAINACATFTLTLEDAEAAIGSTESNLNRAKLPVISNFRTSIVIKAS